MYISQPGGFQILPPRRHLTMSGDNYVYHNRKEGASGIKWIETRVADLQILQFTGKTPPPNTKELSYPIVNSVDIEKLWIR